MSYAVRKTELISVRFRGNLNMSERRKYFTGIFLECFRVPEQYFCPEALRYFRHSDFLVSYEGRGGGFPSFQHTCLPGAILRCTEIFSHFIYLQTFYWEVSLVSKMWFFLILAISFVFVWHKANLIKTDKENKQLFHFQKITKYVRCKNHFLITVLVLIVLPTRTWSLLETTVRIEHM